MSFSENAKKVVTDATGNFVKASGEFVETSKIKYKIYDAGIDRKRLLEKLGRLVYAQHMSGVEDYENKRERLCSDIAEIEGYIKNLKEKLNK